MEDLTPKEQLFVAFYLSNNFNSGKAALDAGYSESSKYVAGHELLRKDKIRRYIDSILQAESVAKLELLHRLSMIARNRGSDYINNDGSLDIEQMEVDGVKWLVKKVRRLKNGRLHYEFYDSQRALEALAKVYGLVNDNPVVTVNIENEITAKDRLNEKLRQLDSKLRSYPNP